MQKADRIQFETPLNSDFKMTQIEITSSGRRRIRPMKYNDFADIKPKSASNENLVSRQSHQELETPPIKESRRRRGDREVIEMGSTSKDLNEMKRTRYNTSATKSENLERVSKRKISLNEDEHDTIVGKRQRTTRESSGSITPNRQTRGRSISSVANIKEDNRVETEKGYKRRRAAAGHSIDESSCLEHVRIKEEPRTSQTEITRFGKYSFSSEKSHTENRPAAQLAIKTEEIEAPRRGRRPKQPPVFESDTQSESTDAGRKFPSRSQRISNRMNEPSYPSEHHSSRIHSQQEQPHSPLTGASTEPSGDECLKSIDKWRGGRRHLRRSRGQSINDQETMQPPHAEMIHSEDENDSIAEEEPTSRNPKTLLADIFTKAAAKRSKRKRSSPITQNKIHGHRMSNRIAAAAAMAKRQPSPSSEHSAASASTPHHSHGGGGGGTSSDDQQPTNKKQMTLPEMMQMQKAKNQSAAEQRYVKIDSAT